MRRQVDSRQPDQQDDDHGAAQDIDLEPLAREGARQHDPQGQVEDGGQKGVARGEAGVQRLDRLISDGGPFALEQGLQALAQGHAPGQADDQQQSRQPLLHDQQEADGD
ncbi:hypothetical protein FQZ97_1047850 [compost metagenome]